MTSKKPLAPQFKPKSAPFLFFCHACLVITCIADIVFMIIFPSKIIILSFILPCLLTFLSFFILAWDYYQYSQLKKLYRRYVAILSTEPVKTVGRIAQLTGASEQAVRENMAKMLQRKFFVNAYVNQAGEVVVPDTTGTADAAQIISRTCPSCGGVNQVVKGKACKCRFCGVYINGQA